VFGLLGGYKKRAWSKVVLSTMDGGRAFDSLPLDARCFVICRMRSLRLCLSSAAFDFPFMHRLLRNTLAFTSPVLAA
jgi:hypothetical protein